MWTFIFSWIFLYDCTFRNVYKLLGLYAFIDVNKNLFKNQLILSNLNKENQGLQREILRDLRIVYSLQNLILDLENFRLIY